MSDMLQASNESEYFRRRLYKDICGVPLMIMSNGQIACFPSSAKESCVVVPDAFHLTIPALRELFVHPIMTQSIVTDNVSLDTAKVLLTNAVFKDVCYVKDVSTQFIAVFKDIL
jgi:hypothetical protein